jgi:pseudaminic acid biosynthesis-associated methylase
MEHKTDQENFWAQDFGNNYIFRNNKKSSISSNINLFCTALKTVNKPLSLIEFGANIGLNLTAIKALYPEMNLHGIEINDKAASILQETIGSENVSKCSILDYKNPLKYDISLIKGVLIHINPEMLPIVYDKLYKSSSRYILICEYYNPTPVSVDYRGIKDRLFKRDFAGEMLDRFDDLNLIDYGFVYKRDKNFPQDDITWFLLKKRIS